MALLPIGFVICWLVFSFQGCLAYHITARSINGCYPIRDILLLPVVMLSMAAAVAFGLNAALDLAPEARHVRGELALYVSCLGQMLGLFCAAILHRRRLIELAMEERQERALV